ncbi:MAG: hypothetical protein RI897_2350 [Verrucomicrobiota bacterium]
MGSHGDGVFFEVHAVIGEVAQGAFEGGDVIVLAVDAGEDAFGFPGGDEVLFAEVVGDIGEVGDGGGEVALPRVGIQGVAFAADAGVDEVAEVVTTAVEFADDIEVEVISDAVGVAILHEVAAGSVEDDADFVPFGAFEEHVDFVVGGVIDGEAAGFEDHAAVAVVVDGDFGIGGITGIDVIGVVSFGLVA